MKVLDVIEERNSRMGQSEAQMEFTERKKEVDILNDRVGVGEKRTDYVLGIFIHVKSVVQRLGRRGCF